MAGHLGNNSVHKQSKSIKEFIDWFFKMSNEMPFWWSINSIIDEQKEG